MATRGRKTLYRNQYETPRIPIVDDALRIIGWADDPPQIIGSRVRHPKAEALLRGPVSCIFVELDDLHDARLAGAPAEWTRAWRCLAIGPEGVISVPMYQARPSSPMPALAKAND